MNINQDRILYQHENKDIVMYYMVLYNDIQNILIYIIVYYKHKIFHKNLFENKDIFHYIFHYLNVNMAHMELLNLYFKYKILFFLLFLTFSFICLYLFVSIPLLLSSCFSFKKCSKYFLFITFVIL